MKMSDKCERCGIENTHSYLCMLQCCGLYSVCYKCWREWHDRDYREMWYTLYRANSYELADKFTLDFLGKLDEFR